MDWMTLLLFYSACLNLWTIVQWTSHCFSNTLLRVQESTSVHLFYGSHPSSVKQHLDPTVDISQPLQHHVFMNILLKFRTGSSSSINNPGFLQMRGKDTQPLCAIQRTTNDLVYSNLGKKTIIRNGRGTQAKWHATHDSWIMQVLNIWRDLCLLQPQLHKSQAFKKKVVINLVSLCSQKKAWSSKGHWSCPDVLPSLSIE